MCVSAETLQSVDIFLFCREGRTRPREPLSHGRGAIFECCCLQPTNPTHSAFNRQIVINGQHARPTGLQPTHIYADMKTTIFMHVPWTGSFPGGRTYLLPTIKQVEVTDLKKPTGQR